MAHWKLDLLFCENPFFIQMCVVGARLKFRVPEAVLDRLTMAYLFMDSFAAIKTAYFS